jgi:hypothetical protein
MNVNIKLNKNFTTAFNKMQDTYGRNSQKLTVSPMGNSVIQTLLITLLTRKQ